MYVHVLYKETNYKLFQQTNFFPMINYLKFFLNSQQTFYSPLFMILTIDECNNKGSK